MRRRLPLAVLASTALLAAAADAAPSVRLRRLDDAKSRASLPFPVDTSGPACNPALPNVPEVLGSDFDPTGIDEIAVAGDARIVAWASTLSEAGLPGPTRDILVFREGVETRDRVSDAGGDNDQPSLDIDRWGFRMAFRGSAASRGSSVGNVYLRTVTRVAATADAGPSENVETVQVTSLVATATDANFGTAYDPTLAARVRVREVESGVKVTERDARVAFVSTGDLQRGRNPDHRPQLFLWREQAEDFVQLTDIAADGFAVNRPSISGGGDRVVFESTADLTPDAADPRDPARVGNPSGVRQIYLWDLRRGVRQLTWSGGDCFSPRLTRNGRAALFCSRGEPIAGGNPEGNFEVFAWVDGGRPSARVRQLTRTVNGQSVLPRPGASWRSFAFWSTAAPADGALAFGAGPALCGPLAYVARGGSVRRVGGLTDTENAQRILASPDPASPENPVVAGPPCPGHDVSKVQFATNDPRLNLPGADDDLDGDDGEGGSVDDRDVDASLIVLHVARAVISRR